MQLAKEDFMGLYISIALPKNSPYTKPVNQGYTTQIISFKLLLLQYEQVYYFQNFPK